MTNTATETRSVVVEREMPFPPEKIWRALTQPHLIEEWLMKNDFKPVVGHRFNLRATGALSTVRSWRSSRTKRCPTRGARLWSRECRHLDAHPNEHGDPPAHGAVGLPAGSAAGLPGRQVRVAAVLCEPGAGLGADRLKVCRVPFRSSSKEVPLNWNKWIWQIHRWLSIIFTATVIANFVTMARRTSRLGGLLGAAAALLAAVHRPVHVRAAVCRQVAQRATHGLNIPFGVEVTAVLERTQWPARRPSNRPRFSERPGN